MNTDRNSFKGPSEETLRAMEMAPNMYLILSPDLLILTASTLFLEATHSTRESIMGKYIFDAFPENPIDDKATATHSIAHSIQEAIKTKTTHQLSITRYDVPNPTKRGQFIRKYWHPSHTPILDENGNVQFIIQLANDVTERIELEEALKNAKTEQQQTLENMRSLSDELVKRAHSELHFKQLADLVPAKISNALPSGEVTFFNKKWLDYSGMSFEDLRDFGYHQMMHPEEITLFQMQLTEAASKCIPLESEMRFKDINGNYRWHLNIASPILNENGEIVMWVGSTTDIHRIKEEEQRRTEFIGMVSHELKTPLTSMQAYIQLLFRKAEKQEDGFTAKVLEQTNKLVRKMSSMVNGFLNVSRYHDGRVNIEKHVINIADVFKDVKGEANLTFFTHIIKFETVSPAFIDADKDKIEQVVNNLLSNAVKYSPVGSNITVSCATLVDEVRVCVQDEGNGIKPEDQKKLFDLYYRVQEHQHYSVGGFGIGLYLCAEIIKQHGGKIWVESDYGEGSKFYFSLPVKSD